MATTSTAVTLVEAPTDMPVLCAWCGATIKEGTRGPASHGICLKCKEYVLAQSGLDPDAAPPDVHEVMGRLASALQERKGWNIGLVCNVMDGICYGTKTRVESECEVMWLARETGLMDVLNAA